MIYRITFLCVFSLQLIHLFAQSTDQIHAKELVRLLKKQKTDNLEISSTILYIGGRDTVFIKSYICSDSSEQVAFMEDSLHFWFLSQKRIDGFDKEKDKRKMYVGDLRQTITSRLSRYFFPSFSDVYLSTLLAPANKVTYYGFKNGYVYHSYFLQGSELDDTFYFFNVDGELVKRITSSVGADRVQNGNNVEYICNVYTHHSKDTDIKKFILSFKK